MKYFIKTYGCQMNKSDSERIAGIFDCLNIKEAKTDKAADIVVLNTCIVRQTAEDRIYGRIKELKKANKSQKIILTGCAALKPKVQKLFKDKVIFLNIKDIAKIPEILGFDHEIGVTDYLQLKPKSQSKFTAFIPIMTGCDNYCAYCVVPYVRGREYSRKPREIINEIKEYLAKGYKEIILLGQNVNSYQYDFPGLMQKINDLSGDFWIRFISSHPKDFSDDLIETIAKSEKITKYVHLPIQAGDDQILQLMNRKYKVKNYLKIINKIRKRISEAAISTDVIVGFPGETRQMFRNTCAVFKKIGFDMAYISRYSPRQGTAAYKLVDDVSPAEKKKRERELTKILAKTALKNNKKLLGRIETVLVESKIKNGFWLGKDGGFRTVKFKGGDNLRGKFVNVNITKADSYGLAGEFVSEKLPRIVVIVGPNAAGKTSLSIKLAKEFNGEIISADSRQVYKWLDLGSGKVTKKEMSGIKHYLLDVAHPGRKFTVVDFQKLAKLAIQEILNKGKMPIVCGGTWYYVQALIDNLQYPEARPNLLMRKQLEKYSSEDLYKKLLKKDPRRASQIHPNNKRRLVRALELIETLNSAVPELKSKKIYDSLWLGVSREKEELKKRIHKRLLERMRQGMVAEVKRIRRKGVSWKRLEELGLEYRYLAYYLQGKMSKEEMLSKLEKEIVAFAKRQMTWFNQEPRIHWIKNYSRAKKLTKEFLK